MKILKKGVIIVLPILALIGIYAVYSFGAPKNIEVSKVVSVESNLPVTNELRDFSFDNFVFEGFTLFGASHEGTFEKYSTEDTANFKGGKIIFEAHSIKTDDAGLDKHLCASDMLDCQKYPTMEFELQSITSLEDSKNKRAVGALTFFGTTKQLSFDLISVGGSEYLANFLFDSLDFGFKYPKIDSKTRIEFMAYLK